MGGLSMNFGGATLRAALSKAAVAASYSSR